MEDHDFLAKIHEAAGCANSSNQPNADLVDVGYDTVLIARFDMDEDTEVLVNYSFWMTAKAELAIILLGGAAEAVLARGKWNFLLLRTSVSSIRFSFANI